MKLVIQRVEEASVTINQELFSSIGKGLLVLFGVQKDDEESAIEYLVQKLLKLRIFEDNEDKMNLSISDIKGEILVVSQFTLCADCRKGTRPSFDNAMEFDMAKKYYEKFISLLKNSGLNIRHGVFGANMKVGLINNGPVTIIIKK